MTLFYYTSILISLSQIVYLFIRTRWEAMQKLLCVRTVDQQITITMKLYQHFDMPIERKISKINQKLMKIQRYVKKEIAAIYIFLFSYILFSESIFFEHYLFSYLNLQFLLISKCYSLRRIFSPLLLS